MMTGGKKQSVNWRIRSGLERPQGVDAGGTVS